MPHSFFILYRLFLRVDNVLFRMYDVRIYHAFGSGEVVREIVGTEADYETIKGVRLSLLPGLLISSCPSSIFVICWSFFILVVSVVSLGDSS
jgi:hypothetical protein